MLRAGGWARQALRGAAAFPVDPADAIQTMRVIEAARLAAQDHRIVRLAPDA
ncbi:MULTISPECIES: hypothetical protein [unclassified Amycolatopsis]|uniref:hypothetical protein n=1 Tax=unclassified Amycolatopsis TaxID=2618356 RepID=UPI001C697EFE|nr:hypothetical protein [Amycolatopsis sp. DSM 110486]QYN19024.1 hypothetical protein K1T34_41120 [Amycolatopsis sp. DSM 110486]